MQAHWRACANWSVWQSVVIHLGVLAVLGQLYYNACMCDTPGDGICLCSKHGCLLKIAHCGPGGNNDHKDRFKNLNLFVAALSARQAEATDACQAAGS